jgi:quinone-modifying oxidoreductase subunit QmoC
MAGATLVRPDRRFVEDLIASGGGDLKKCFQCATCSAVCELSDGGPPFPRKEMIWAQWGLRDRLLSDPDIWLCHQCNDCSKRCPRGARPGDVLAAVRRQAIQHYAVPRFFARWVNQVRFVPVTFLLPVALLALALVLRAPIEEAVSFHHHPGFYADFFPHWLLIGFYGLFTGLAAAVAVVGIVRHWKAMRGADEASGGYAPRSGVVASILRTLTSVAVHDRFGSCEAQASRRVAHLTAFYGFLALYVVTLWAVIDIYVNPALGIQSLYPFGLMHPMKMLANVGGVLLIFGATRAILDRRREGPGSADSTSFDWIFVWTLLGVGVTGFAVEVLRFAVEPTPPQALQTLAYAVYFVHLALVFHLLVYLPYSKFAHVIYRFVAMVYAEHTGRHRAVGRKKTPLRARLTAGEPSSAREA